jgi:hypothetical protein
MPELFTYEKTISLLAGKKGVGGVMIIFWTIFKVEVKLAGNMQNNNLTVVFQWEIFGILLKQCLALLPGIFLWVKFQTFL